MSAKRSVGTGLLACVVMMTASAASGEVIRKGRHYRIVFDGDDTAIATAALRAAEAVWPQADRLFGTRAEAPDEPMDIRLLSTVEAYEKIEGELTKGAFRANLAFTHYDSRTACVVMQPVMSARAVKALGLTAMTRRLIAHEAVHLWRVAALPNHASHPDWLATGAAGWIDDEVVRRLGGPDPESDPLTSTYAVQLQRLVAAGQLPSIEKILRDDLDALPVTTSYALRRMLFRFMLAGDHRGAWMELMGTARQLGGGKDYAERLRSEVTKKLAPGGWSPLDAELRRFIETLTPEWDEVYRSLEVRGRSWIQAAFPTTNAIAWHTAPVGAESFTISGELNVIDGDKRQMNLLLGRSDDLLHTIAFTGGFGVNVFRYSSDRDRWDELGNRPMRALAAGKWVKFKAIVADGQLTVQIGDEDLTVSLQGRSLSGPWGVGAQAGSAGTWRAMAIRIANDE